MRDKTFAFNEFLTWHSLEMGTKLSKKADNQEYVKRSFNNEIHIKSPLLMMRTSLLNDS